MPDTRALEGHTGGPSLSNPAAIEGMEVPETNRSAIAAWLHKFSSRNTRRGSIGFSGEPGEKAYRVDEDSNDGIATNISANKAIVDQLRGESSPFNLKRLRNDSMSDLQTPGGDGDLHFFSAYRRRPSVETPTDISSAVTHLRKDGVLALNTDDKMDIDRNPSFNTLQPIIEEMKLPAAEKQNQVSKPMELDSEGGLQMKADHLATLRQEQNLQMSPGEAQKASTVSGADTNENIFLIDLEATQDGNKLKLTSKPKKFSLTSVLNSGWAQNWFFRNDGVEDEEANKQDVVKEKVRKISRCSTPGTEGEEGDEENKHQNNDNSFIGKIQQAMAEHPSRMREMNIWQPQSS